MSQKFGDAATKCKSPCSRGVKRPGQPLPSIRLLYITDSATGLKFLVDTAEALLHAPNICISKIISASRLPTIIMSLARQGTRSLILNLGVLSAGSAYVLGADFLRHMDLKCECLVDTLSNTVEHPGNSTHDPSPSPTLPPHEASISLRNFHAPPDVTKVHCN